MFYFLVAFIALTAIKQWNPLFRPQAAVYCSFDSCLSAYKNGFHVTTCPMDGNTFPYLDLSLKTNSMKSILHPYYIVTGLMTHNTSLMTHSNVGRTTHNMAGHMTKHKSFVSFFKCNYCLMPGCTTSLPVSLSSTHHNVTTSCSMTKKTYPSCQCCHIIILSQKKRLKTIQLYLSNSVISL